MKPRPAAQLVTGPKVLRMWPNSTIACIGGGPSLTREDVEVACAHWPVIAVNDAYKLIPAGKTDAVLYACDAKWWGWHRGVPSFAGPKYSLDKHAARWPGVVVLRNTGTSGLEPDPSGLRTGRNSGYQAINLAVHLGASRILLLGYDMAVGKKGKAHWFGHHPDNVVPPFRLMISEYKTLVAPLKAAGVSVVNCSRETALDAFPRSPLEQELPRPQEVAC